MFSEDGHYLRRIGCENLTNFPNGIDISDAGDVLIGDSHGNRFHVAVFSRDGSLISEFECPYVKVSSHLHQWKVKSIKNSSSITSFTMYRVIRLKVIIRIYIKAFLKREFLSLERLKKNNHFCRKNWSVSWWELFIPKISFYAVFTFILYLFK